MKNESRRDRGRKLMELERRIDTVFGQFEMLRIGTQKCVALWKARLARQKQKAIDGFLRALMRG